MSDSTLLADVAIALTLAFAGGLAAQLLGLPTIPGFLLAGLVISPFTPGYVADAEVLHLMAEIGVVLLLFGVGLHFKLEHLVEVQRVAVPGALIQMTLTTVIGAAGAAALGLNWRGALVFGLAASVASTVVLTRTLEARGRLNSAAGHLAVGWLVVQDLAMVLVLALIPALAAANDSGGASLEGFALAIGKAALFLGVVLGVGARLLPPILRYVARTGSRELFILATMSTALAVAAAAAYFSISVALGAFVAGLAISEAQTSQAAADEVFPLREAFAALFFVSVGMLLDPAALLGSLPFLLLTLALVAMNAAVAYVVIGLVGGWRHTAAIVAVGLAQIGEFSFIIAETGVSAGVLQAGAYNAILGASVVSIALNPLVQRLVITRPRVAVAVA